MIMIQKFCEGRGRGSGDSLDDNNLIVCERGENGLDDNSLTVY